MESRFLSFVFAVALGVSGAACDSHSASPSAPSPTQLTNASGSAGATVQGTVGMGNGKILMADSVRALVSSGGARVSVVGRSMATSTDASGRFMLRDVPSGQVQLRIEASGVDARLDVGMVSPGQTVNLDMEVEGQNANVTQADDGQAAAGAETEFSGAITSLSPLIVAGHTVMTDANTRFQDEGDKSITLSSLKVGDQVEVEGNSQTDGSVLAKKISLRN